MRITIDGGEWLVDSCLLTKGPLPLRQEVFVNADPVFAVEVEPAEATYVAWVDIPPSTVHLPCRLLADPMDHACYLAAYEASRERSPFNRRLYARRIRPGELLVLLGNTRFSKAVEGLRSRDLSPDEVCEALRQDRLLHQLLRIQGSLARTNALEELPRGHRAETELDEKGA